MIFPQWSTCNIICFALRHNLADDFPRKAHNTLTLSPEAQAPFSRGNLPVAVRVARGKEGPDAHLILLQVYSGQLGLIQEQVITGVQLGEHPADGVLTAGHEPPVKPCSDNTTTSKQCAL